METSISGLERNGRSVEEGMNGEKKSRAYMYGNSIMKLSTL